jgi:hypothetical protein
MSASAGTRSAVRAAVLVLLAILMLGMAGWGVLALLYWDDAPTLLRRALATAFGLLTLALVAALVSRRWRWRAVAVFAALLALLVARWRALEPTNDRDWVPENAVLAYATFDGELVTLHNVRNFDYHSDTDFTAAYYDRTYDLRQLNSVDLYTVYWMGPKIAHVFVSFGFSDGNHVAISIEARKARGQGYSSVKGFFRQYELYYVVADERDVVRLRTNYRHDPAEEVQLYVVRAAPANIRRVFLEYLRKIDGLRDKPEWYNSLTDNCTSNIWLNARVNPGTPPYSWKIVLSGYVPEYMYEHGILDTSVPFTELQRRAVVNARAQAADQAPDFSRRIRTAP